MSKARILIVEDEKIVALDIDQRLRNLGFEVAGVASSSEEAIMKVEETNPDLVLMDIMLRGRIDGIQTAREVRTRFEVPVVFLTAYVDDATLDRAKVSEPYGYILKPFEERELHSAIVLALYKHEMEDKLRVSEHWLASTLSCLGDGVIATDDTGLVKFVNPTAEKLVGLKSSEAISRPLSTVFEAYDERSGEPIENPVQTVLNGDVPQHPTFSVLVSARDGRRRPVEVSIAAIEGGKNRLLGIVLVLRDISERRKGERERELLKEQLRQSQKMEAVGQLAGGIAHDFNNILTGIVGHVSLAKKKAGEEVVLHLNQIEGSCQRATDFIRKLLSFSRNVPIELVSVDVGIIIDEVLELCRNILESRIEVSVDLEESLHSVLAEATQIHQVLLNLCVNARDAIEERRQSESFGDKSNENLLLRITASNVILREHDPEVALGALPGEYVLITVSDTGQGMSEQTIERIFEPFFTTKEEGKGTGLGLSVVYGIVRQLGGWITVSSTIGSGTTFKLFFRAAGVRAAQQSPEVRAKEPPIGTETILIVEDQDVVRDVTKAMLEELGYTVIAAGSGKEGLEILLRERHRIALIISDMSMPGMGGPEFLQRVRAIDPSARIICSSGNVLEEFLLNAQFQRCQFLPKPYDFMKLAQTVRHALDADPVEASQMH